MTSRSASFISQCPVLLWLQEARVVIDKIRCVEIGPDNLDLLLSVPEVIFDSPVRPIQAKAFVEDAAYLLVLALEAEKPVGFASAVINLHPDKDPILFVSEAGVTAGHCRKRIARQKMRADDGG